MSRFRNPLVALTVLSTLALVSCAEGSRGTRGIDGDDTATRATPGALVAVALSYLDTSYELNDLSSIKSDTIGYLDFEPRTIGANINFRGPDSLQVTVGPSQPVPRCPVPGRIPDRCIQDRDPSGTTQVSWDLEEPEEDPGVVVVMRFTEDDVRRVALSGPKITQDPRKLDLPRVGSVATMRAIVEDPAFGWTTTQGALDAAEKLGGWPGSTDQAADPGPLEPWTPRMLGNLASHRLWYLDHVREVTAPEPAGPTGTAKGIRFSGSRVGTAVSIYLLPRPPAGATTCPRGYTCTAEDTVTYAWASGRAAVFRERPGFVVRIYYVDKRLEEPGRTSFDSGDLAELVTFTDDPGIGARMSTDWADLERSTWEDD